MRQAAVFGERWRRKRRKRQRPSIFVSHWRRSTFEILEERALLSVAQDIVNQLAPYQTALNNALDVATSLPLVGDQLQDLQEFNTILQDSLARIEAATQNLSSGHFELAISLPSISETFTFDLGLDAFLQVTTAGGVNASITPVLNVGFDYQNGNVSLDLAHTNLDIGFGLSLPNFQATMSLNGLLFTRAVDQGTNFQGHLKFGFDSGGSISPQFSGEAHVRLGLTMSFVDPALNVDFNPTFKTKLEMDWGFNTQNNQMLAPSIKLVDFGLDADSFMHGFLGDIVETVGKFTKPLQPFIDIFDTPVPILSAFDSSQTLGDLILKGAGLSEEQQDRFNFMVEIIKAVNLMDLSGSTGGAVITFGTINLTGDARETGGFNFDTSQISGVIDDIFNLPALDEMQETLETVANFAGLNSTAGFKFHLLEDPGSVIGAILTGQTAAIFSYSTGRQHFDLAASVGVGIEDLIGIFLSAGIVFDANLTMGYDTAGLIKLAQTHQPTDLLHGFYFDNSVDTSGPPIPNVPDPRKTALYLQGFMELKASAIVTLSGGLYANVSVELASTDSSSHVHLDSMVQNLAAGAKVFDLGGQIYAAASIELTLPNPVGPDITFFSYELGHHTLLDFDPPPSPSLGLPLTVIDVTNQHTLLLDVSKMTPGGAVKVQSYHDYVAAGTTYAGDGIRVDYPNEIVLYVERKDDTTTNYYNLIGLSGAVPDGVTISITDPFRVFVDEGAPDPAPAATKSGVLLAGGKNVGFKYTEAPNGTHPTVLLAGGYGSNTLTGGTMMFGNFIPGDRIAQAKAHFGNVTGYDGAGAAYINSAIDAVLAPASPSGIIGATMTGSRGGLMVGGPGANSFIATGPGAYEMIGGAWVDSFNISPSFGGVPATYVIDGGGGENRLTVRVPAGDMADFEKGTAPDKYNSAYKSLSIFSNAGQFATADGIQNVTASGEKGATVILGDTSELDIKFKVTGSVKLTFGGTAAPDVLDVSPVHVNQGFLSPYGTRNHSLPRLLVPPSTSLELSHNLADYGILVPGTQTYPGYFLEDPKYFITRTFGTTHTTQVVPFQAGIDGQGQIVLNGGGASDEYRLKMGFGSFLDVTIEDSDETTQNSLIVDVREGLLIKDRATLTDTSLHLEYYTQAQPIFSIPNNNGERPFTVPESIVYTPTIYFDSNTDITLYGGYGHTIINRPLAPQHATIKTDASSNQSVYPYSSVTLPVALILDRNATSLTFLDFTNAHPTLDVLANGGMLTIDESGNAVTRQAVNIYANTGTLVIDSVHPFGFGVETFNVFGNTGNLTIHNKIYSFINIFQVLSVDHTVNVLANSGTINLHDEGSPEMNSRFAEAVVNIGNNGSLANVHGVINFSNSNSRYDLSINDSNGTGNRPWTINWQQTLIGDLSLNYEGVNSSSPIPDFYSRYRAFANAGSEVTADSNPPFYLRLFNNDNMPIWQVDYLSSQFVRGGDPVDIPISILGGFPGTATYAATNLPPGVSVNSAGHITGTIAPQAYLLSMPRSTTVSVTAGGITRRRIFDWYISSGIQLLVPEINTSLLEGTAVNIDPITTTNNFNRDVTVTVTGLPAGLSFDQGTGKIIGTVAVGAAQGGPYHTQIHATDGFESADFEFDWYVTGITFAETPLRRMIHVGDAVNFAVSATTVSGAPVDYLVEGLPDGLSFNPTTRVISGVVTAAAADTQHFSTSVQATQGLDSNSISIEWFALPAGVNNEYTITDPGPQIGYNGDFVNIDIFIFNTLNLPFTFQATGLPPGLSLQDNDGSYRIGGMIEEGAHLTSPYHVTILADDGFYTGEVSFDWTVGAVRTVYLNGLDPQYSTVGTPITPLALSAVSTLDEQLTYSAIGLPPGLSVDPVTGIISGTPTPSSTSYADFHVFATATAASGIASIDFYWTVASSNSSNRAILARPDGLGVIEITTPVGTALNASITGDSDLTLPGGIVFPFGFLEFSIYTAEFGAAADLTITGFDVSEITGYYKYGATPANSADHWYNFLFGVPTDGDSAVGTGMQIVGNNIVLHLKDGGRGDDDISENGIIADVGGPAVVVPPPELPGDYNLDENVDASDYVLWRGTSQQSVPIAYEGADGNGDRVIGPQDYDVWRAHFGNMLPHASVSNTAAANSALSSTFSINSDVGPQSVGVGATTPIELSGESRRDSFFSMPMSNLLLTSQRTANVHPALSAAHLSTIERDYVGEALLSLLTNTSSYRTLDENLLPNSSTSSPGCSDDSRNAALENSFDDFELLPRLTGVFPN